MTSFIHRALLMTFCLLPATPSQAQQGPDQRIADIKSSGKLRVGLGLVPTFAVKNPSTGELRGVAVVLAQALAERIGVEVVPVTYPSPANIPEGVKANALDIGFLGIDPARLAVMDFSIPYVQVDATFLFKAGSTFKTFEDVDKPGVRIVTTRNGVEDLALTRLAKAAEIIRVGSAGAGLEALKDGKADAIAIPRPTAIAFAEQVPGTRIWDGRYDVAIHAIGVPKGEVARLAYINEFLSNAKKTGFVQQAMERGGLRGAQVAPD